MSSRWHCHCTGASCSGGVLITDDLARDYEALTAKGVKFAKPPTREPYGFAAVLVDDSGNYWSLGEER